MALASTFAVVVDLELVEVEQPHRKRRVELPGRGRPNLGLDEPPFAAVNASVRPSSFAARRPSRRRTSTASEALELALERLGLPFGVAAGRPLGGERSLAGLAELLVVASALPACRCRWCRCSVCGRAGVGGGRRASRPPLLCAAGVAPTTGTTGPDRLCPSVGGRRHISPGQVRLRASSSSRRSAWVSSRRCATGMLVGHVQDLRFVTRRCAAPRCATPGRPTRSRTTAPPAPASCRRDRERQGRITSSHPRRSGPSCGAPSPPGPSRRS
jgi:hypothetical protein